MAKKDDDFFGEEKQEEQEPEKIKLGEKEYSQDELSKLVGLGEVASELETKWNTKIDRLYPEFTKKSQQLSEYEAKVKGFEESKQKEIETKPQEQLSPEEQSQLIKQELKKYGVVTTEDFNKLTADFMAGKEILSDIDSLLEEAKSDGKPVTTQQELLNYMSENGVRNPNAAYKLMFESELDAWKEKQLGKIKQPSIESEGSSAAGGKEPTPVKVTRENLGQLLSDALGE
jgi:hypothetical protein